MNRRAVEAEIEAEDALAGQEAGIGVIADDEAVAQRQVVYRPELGVQRVTAHAVADVHDLGEVQVEEGLA